MVALFGGPNNWAVDSKESSRKTSRPNRAARAYVRDLHAAGVFYPDPNLNASTLKATFMAEKFAVMPQGWAAYGSPERIKEIFAHFDFPGCTVRYPGVSADPARRQRRRFQLR
jgi:hypothetical protein